MSSAAGPTIGASRARLIRQLLIEGLTLGALGAIVAVGSAWVLIRALLSIDLPLPVSVALDVRLDGRVLALSLAVALVTGLLAGLLPALKASAPSLTGDLRGESPAARVAGHRWALRDALVVSQVALTAVLLVVAGLLLRSLSASHRADVGFRTSGLALVSFDTDMVRYAQARGEQFWVDVLARVRELPGVESAATSTPTVPFELNFSQQEFQIDDRAYVDGARGETIENRAISPGYLDTMGIRLLEGRDVQESDRRGGPLVAVVNATMARMFWPNQSAVGHTIRVASTNAQYQIVGVVADHKNHGVLERPAPLVHLAAAQRPSTYNGLIARTSGDARALLASIRHEVLAIEPGLVLMNNSTMEDRLALSLMPARVGATLAAGFGALGTLLASIGLYGVIAFSVARRTREIGVRMALGAKPRGVLRMVMGQGFTLVVVGLILGGLLAAGAARVLSGLLFNVSPFDPLAWTLATTAMLSAAA